MKGQGTSDLVTTLAVSGAIAGKCRLKFPDPKIGSNRKHNYKSRYRIPALIMKSHNIIGIFKIAYNR